MNKQEKDESSNSETKPLESSPSYMRSHLLIGWWSLLTFLSLGVILEAMHGFKIGWYLDVNNETRRLMWTLAHAHGVLLSLVHIVFGVCTHLVATSRPRWRAIASCSLTVSSILLPAGFFLGGIYVYDGDPGLGIFLVPPGALLLFVAVLLSALDMTKPQA